MGDKEAHPSVSLEDMSIYPFDGTPVAVFDLDGCLCAMATTHNQTIECFDFWAKIWENVDHPTNPELMQLLRALAMQGWHIAILTARPERFRPDTYRWLVNQGLADLMDESVSLTMYPDVANLSAGDWKAMVIEYWTSMGMSILFAVEDYPPNAKAIRKVIPVLLYERKK